MCLVHVSTLFRFTHFPMRLINKNIGFRPPATPRILPPLLSTLPDGGDSSERSSPNNIKINVFLTISWLSLSFFIFALRFPLFQRVVFFSAQLLCIWRGMKCCFLRCYVSNAPRFVKIHSSGFKKRNGHDIHDALIPCTHLGASYSRALPVKRCTTENLALRPTVLL